MHIGGCRDIACNPSEPEPLSLEHWNVDDSLFEYNETFIFDNLSTQQRIVPLPKYMQQFRAMADVSDIFHPDVYVQEPITNDADSHG